MQSNASLWIDTILPEFIPILLRLHDSTFDTTTCPLTTAWFEWLLAEGKPVQECEGSPFGMHTKVERVHAQAAGQVRLPFRGEGAADTQPFPLMPLHEGQWGLSGLQEVVQIPRRV